MYYAYCKLCQSPKPNFFFKSFNQLPRSIWTNKETESAHVLKLSKLITSKARYQNPRNMKFHRADRLCFNNDVFSCAMVHLVHLDYEILTKKGISFITLISRMITSQILRKLN